MLAEDPTLLAAFLDESRDALAGLESRLVGLDRATDVRGEVEAIFRPVHTLKGNAPFFGFMQLQRLAHAVETILDRLRKGRMPCSQAVTDALLAGFDGLRDILERIRAGKDEVADTAAFAALHGRLEVCSAMGGSDDPWDAVFASLAELESADAPDDHPVITRLRESLTAIHGRHRAAPAAPAAAVGDAIARVRQRLATPLATPLEPAAATAVLALLREIRAACGDPAQQAVLDDTLATCDVFIGSVGFDDVLRQHVLERVARLPAASPASPPVTAIAATAPASAAAIEPGSERRTRPESEGQVKSMRVSEAAVDGFLAHVGDLLVIGDQLEHLQARLTASRVEPALARDMRQAVAAFSSLSSELQRSIMIVRRVQVRGLLQKAPRIVRDIAQANGKDIAVVIAGEATEIDKGRLDLLDGPLTHLVRNCADHGIEPPAVRTAAGKPARGTITLTASAEDGWFSLAIADDGKGLDLDAIRRKGEALGLVQPGAALDERAIIDLIFASGLSTAAAVTDVSGRGVGMDVVKRQIDEAGGSVGVTTVRGRGTTFLLRLPSAVSTQIMPAFLVRDGAGIFALPLELVRESFVADGIDGEGRGVVMRHGSVLPVAPLGRALGQPPAPGSATAGRRTCVTIERNGSTSAITVDETLGVRRLVIRPLHGPASASADRRFQGAALLGDGQLALVVDPDRLLQLVRHG